MTSMNYSELEAKLLQVTPEEVNEALVLYGMAPLYARILWENNLPPFLTPDKEPV